MSHQPTKPSLAALISGEKMTADEMDELTDLLSSWRTMPAPSHTTMPTSSHTTKPLHRKVSKQPSLPIHCVRPKQKLKCAKSQAQDNPESATLQAEEKASTVTVANPITACLPTFPVEHRTKRAKAREAVSVIEKVDSHSST